MREGLRIYNLFPTLAGPIAGWTAQLPRIAGAADDGFSRPGRDAGLLN